MIAIWCLRKKAKFAVADVGDGGSVQPDQQLVYAIVFAGLCILPV